MQGAAFSYIGAERRVPRDHPLRAIRAMANQALEKLSSHFDTLYAKNAALDFTGKAAAGAVAAGAVFDTQRAAVDRAVGLQPAVPLVRGG